MPATSPRIQPLTFPRSQSLALSIVVAAQDGGACLPALLERLREARVGVTYEVILVVGGEAAGALAGVRREHPLVLLYRAPEAQELGALYDVGAGAAGGRLLLLLDGTSLPDAAAIAELVRFAETGQWIAAVVPRLVCDDGAELPATRSFPTPARAIAEALGRGAEASTPAPRLQFALNRKVTTPKEVEAVVGGCVLVRRQAVLDIGGFAAGYPAGGEILDWCMRARLRGWAIFYHPATEARLVQDAAAPTPAARRAIARHFVRRFYGLLPAGLLALAAAPAALGERRQAQPAPTDAPAGDQVFGQGMNRAALPAGTTA